MSPIIPSSAFYVYILKRPDGSPFYVGKGRGARVNHHENEARRGCACHKCKVIRKIWRSGGEVVKDIVLVTDKEEEALQVEERLIVQLWGLLTNTKVGYDRWYGARARRGHSANLQGQMHVWRSERVKGRALAERRLEYLTNRLAELKDICKRATFKPLSPDERRRIDAEIEALRIALRKDAVVQHGLWHEL